MTNKKLLICIISMMALLNMQAQDFEFHPAAGLSFVQVGSFWAPGLVLSPRLNVLDLSDNASLSIGTETSIMYYKTANGTKDLPEQRFGYDIPLFVSVNIGRAANSFAIDQMGFVVGVGYSFGKINLKGQEYEIVEQSDGIVIKGGVRFEAFENKTLSFDISQAFGRGTTKGSLNSLSVRFLYYFRDY